MADKLDFQCFDLLIERKAQSTLMMKLDCMVKVLCI